MGTTVTYYKGWVVGWFTNWIALTLWLMMTDLIYWLTDWLIGWWWGDVPMTGGKESPGERGPPFIAKYEAFLLVVVWFEAFLLVWTWELHSLMWVVHKLSYFCWWWGSGLHSIYAGRALIELILLVVKIWVAQHLCRSCVNWDAFAGGEDLDCTAFMRVVRKLSCLCWWWRCSVCMCIYM
jgi:hypothetical protein